MIKNLFNNFKKNPKIVVPGGGSGCVTIEDELLNITPYVIGITGICDNGGHSGEIRSVLGLLPPGDATHRMAVRIRDPKVRELFTHRWNLKTKEGNGLHGHRPSNELLAAAETLEKSHSKGIKLIEYALKAHYRGQVIPISDDNTHLRAILEDGSFIDYEDQIDTRTTNTPPIIKIEFLPKSPRPNPQALEAFSEADIIFIPPSSWWTSHMPILKTSGVSEAIKGSKAKIIWCCNAFTNFSDTDGYVASKFASQLYQVLGRKIDYALFNKFEHQIPPAYANIEKSFPVRADEAEIKKCGEFINSIKVTPLTQLSDIEGKLVVRHNGELVSKLVIDFWKNFPKSKNS